MHDDIDDSREFSFYLFFDAVRNAMGLLNRHAFVNEYVEIEIDGTDRTSCPYVMGACHPLYAAYHIRDCGIVQKRNLSLP